MCCSCSISLLRVVWGSRRTDEWNFRRTLGCGEREGRSIYFWLQIPAQRRLILRLADFVARGDQDSFQQRASSLFHPYLPVDVLLTESQLIAIDAIDGGVANQDAAIDVRR